MQAIEFNVGDRWMSETTGLVFTIVGISTEGEIGVTMPIDPEHTIWCRTTQFIGMVRINPTY